MKKKRKGSGRGRRRRKYRETQQAHNIRETGEVGRKMGRIRSARGGGVQKKENMWVI